MHNRTSYDGLLAGSPNLRRAVRNARNTRRRDRSPESLPETVPEGVESTAEGGAALDAMLAEIWPEVQAEGAWRDELTPRGRAVTTSSTESTAAPAAAFQTPRLLGGIGEDAKGAAARTRDGASVRASGGETVARLWQPVLELTRLPWGQLYRAQPSKPLQVALARVKRMRGRCRWHASSHALSPV